jgi:hypothetical protein
MSAEAVAWFCENLGQLRRRALELGAAEEIAAMTAAVLALGDLDADEVRELSRRLGGPEPQLRSPGPIPGVDPGPSAQIEYRCPADRCDRLGRRAPGGPHPTCNIDGSRLKLQAASS